MLLLLHDESDYSYLSQSLQCAFKFSHRGNRIWRKSGGDFLDVTSKLFSSTTTEIRANDAIRESSGRAEDPSSATEKVQFSLTWSLARSAARWSRWGGREEREGGEGIPGSVWNRAFRRKVQLKSPRDEMRDRADQCSRARLPAGDRGAARRGRGKGAACLSNSPSLLRHLLPTSNAGAWGVPRGSRYRAALSACSASRRQTSAITQPHDPANMSAYVPPYCARTAQVTVLAPARLLLYNNYRLIKICYLTLR
jgi:hypothetical protein